MRFLRRTLALAAAVAAAACTSDVGSARHPTGPHFTVTSATVTCPDTISVGQSAQCVAYFYDQNGNLISNATPTWGTTTATLISVGSTGVATGLAVGSAVVQATYSGVTGNKSVYVKPGLTVSILGPSTARRWTTCTWYKSVSGGTAPYTYQWSDEANGGSLNNTGTSYQVYLISAEDDIYLTVTDANGVQASVAKHITVTATAPLC